MIEKVINVFRDKTIDIMRGFAILFVVLGHVMSNSLFLKGWIYSFHMPLFFLISGMVFNTKKFSKFSDYFKYKVKKLILPYIYLSILLWILYFLTNIGINLINGNVTNYKDLLMKFVYIFIGYRDKYYFSMWYLLVLFFIELISYFYIKINNNYIKYIGLLLISIIGYICGNYLNGFYYSLDLVPLGLTFFLMGYYFNKVKDKIKDKHIKFILPGSLIINIVFCILNAFICGRISFFANDLGNYFYFYLSSIGGMMFIYLISKLIKNNSFLEYFGNNSLVIYTFNNSFAILLIKNLLNRVGIDNYGNIFQVLLCFSLVMIILICLCELINKYIPFVIGKSNSKCIFKKEENVL